MFSQKTKNNVRNFLSQGILFSLMLLLALSPALQAQNRSTNRKVVDESILVNPLARSDARAQLDPALQNAQPMPAAETEQSFNSEPTMLDYDQATGKETRTVGQSAALHEDITASSGSPGVRQLAETAEASGAEAQTENYLCVDDKVAIHSTAYPWSTQVKLFMTFPNGHTYVGSGTMIASKYVITHKNNLYYAAFGGWATRVEAIPALDGFYKPFGSAFSVRLRWYNHGASNIGLITLDRHIGFSTGWLGYGSFTDATLRAYTGHIAGYPVSKAAGRVLYYDFGATTTPSFDQARVAVLFLAGEMGAGNYFRNSVGNRYVFGVSANAYYCSTTSDRLTSWIFSQVQGVIASGL
jgi:hypothetical protein